MYTDATVGFSNSALNVTEGEILEVCLELSYVPSGGLACPIAVYLSALPYTDEGKLGIILFFNFEALFGT